MLVNLHIKMINQCGYILRNVTIQIYLYHSRRQRNQCINRYRSCFMQTVERPLEQTNTFDTRRFFLTDCSINTLTLIIFEPEKFHLLFSDIPRAIRFEDDDDYDATRLWSRKPNVQPPRARFRTCPFPSVISVSHLKTSMPITLTK